MNHRSADLYSEKADSNVRPDRDERYQYLRDLIIAGSIRSFEEIFKIVPRYVICGDLNENPKRFNERLKHRPETFRYKTIYQLSERIGIDYKLLSSLFNDHIISCKSNAPSHALPKAR